MGPACASRLFWVVKNGAGRLEFFRRPDALARILIWTLVYID